MKRFLIPVALISLVRRRLGFRAQPGNPFAPKKRSSSFADLGKVTVEVTPKEAKPGETVQVKLTVETKPAPGPIPSNPKTRISRAPIASTGSHGLPI